MRAGHHGPAYLASPTGHRPAHTPVPHERVPPVKKFSRFAAAVSATAVLASGAVLAPAASALDLKVEGETCTITESYEGEAKDIAVFFEKAADASLANLKKALPEHADDIDVVLNSSDAMDREAAAARIEEAAQAKGFSEGEVTAILWYLRDLDVENPDAGLAEGLTRTEAADRVSDFKKLRAALVENQLPDANGGTTSSAPAITVVAPAKTAFLKVLDLEIGVYQSCADGKDGTFDLDTTTGGIGGGSAKLSSGSSL